MDNSRFWDEIMHPFALALLALPFIVSGLLMYFSSRADKKMKQILHEFEQERFEKDGLYSRDEVNK